MSASSALRELEASPLRRPCPPCEDRGAPLGGHEGGHTAFRELGLALEQPKDPRAWDAAWSGIRPPAGAVKSAPPTRAPAVTIADLVAHPERGTAERYVRAEWERWAHAHGARAGAREASERRWRR